MHNGVIQTVDLNRRQIVFTERTLHTGEIIGLAWCDTQRLITASRDGKLVLWQHRHGVLTPYTAWDTRSGINAIELSKDGKLCYVASAGESISVFNLAAMESEFVRLGIAEGGAEHIQSLAVNQLLRKQVNQ